MAKKVSTSTVPIEYSIWRSGSEYVVRAFTSVIAVQLDGSKIPIRISADGKAWALSQATGAAHRALAELVREIQPTLRPSPPVTAAKKK
jgi:hypothetical protein